MFWIMISTQSSHKAQHNHYKDSQFKNNVMKISEFELEHPNSPVIAFFKTEPIAILLIGIFVFTLIAKIF